MTQKKKTLFVLHVGLLGFSHGLSVIHHTPCFCFYPINIVNDVSHLLLTVVNEILPSTVDRSGILLSTAESRKLFIAILHIDILLSIDSSKWYISTYRI